MGDARFENQLFEKEIKILESATEYISNNNHTDDELFIKYQQLIEDYKKLLKVSKKIFKISDAQGREIKKSEEEIKNLLDNSNQGFLTCNEDLIVNTNYSAECIRIFNEKIGNRNILELLFSNNLEQNELFKNCFEAIFRTDNIELRNQHISELPKTIIINDKHVQMEYKFINQTENPGEKGVLMLILTDITERIRTDEKVNFLSYHDELTSLYNRTYIENIFPDLQSKQNLPLGLIVGDMNALKFTNDVFGHIEGDRLIVNMANILAQCCRNRDIVARWGGDEFIILLPQTEESTCQKVCERIKMFCNQTRWDPVGPSIALGIEVQKDLEMDFSQLFNIAENRMYKDKTFESRNIKRKIILNMEKILSSRCCESLDHLDRVENLAVELGKKADVIKSQAEQDTLVVLARMHDVGKVAINTDLLKKPASLNQNEWEIIKNHSEIGFRMAQAIDEPALANAILSIHEYWDGSGYPEGLKGEQIPVLSRILSIVDAFDTMTHDQPYKKAVSTEEAIEELKKCSGTQFDPGLVKSFIEHVL